MDWIRMAQQDFRPSDFKLLHWSSRKSRVVQMLVKNTVDLEVSQSDLTTDDEWNEWFEKHLLSIQDVEKGLTVILGGRADDEQGTHNPKLLSHFPWTMSTFQEIIRRMQVNGSIVGVIHHGDPVFSRTCITRKSDGIPVVAYNCRSSNTWPGHMALSVTYIPSRRSSYGIMYGCSPETTKEVTGRLKLAEDIVCHPMLLPGIFAELERRRHLSLVKDGLLHREQFVTNLLENNMYDWKLRNTDEEEDASTRESVDLWMDICYLRNGLKGWRHQLYAMISHVDELSQTHFSDTLTNRVIEKDSLEVCVTGDEVVKFNQAMRKAGTMIKERLEEIILDYDEKIRDCDMIMDGMTMATQLAHTKANMEIALRTKRDGSQMKSIAFLTMFFLPGTFVATLFSTSFFVWQPQEGQSMVSHWFWLYVVITVLLTAIVIGLWDLHANWESKRTKRTKRDEEAGVKKKTIAWRLKRLTHKRTF